MASTQKRIKRTITQYTSWSLLLSDFHFELCPSEKLVWSKRELPSFQGPTVWKVLIVGIEPATFRWESAAIQTACTTASTGRCHSGLCVLSLSVAGPSLPLFSPLLNQIAWISLATNLTTLRSLRLECNRVFGLKHCSWHRVTFSPPCPHVTLIPPCMAAASRPDGIADAAAAVRSEPQNARP